MNLSINEAPPELLAIISRQAAVAHNHRIFSQSTVTASDAQNMLDALNPDMPYDDWLRVGMALHAEGLDVSLWDVWSAKSTKHKAGECGTKWASFNGARGVSGGTLIHMAQQAGYRFKNAPESSGATPNAFRKRAPIPLWHWSELHNIPRRAYLVKGLLDQGGMSVTYGQSNSGKSFIALDMACHIALGWKWRGMRVTKGAVVYIAAEGGLGISERLEAFRLHHGLTEYPDVYVIPANVCLGKNDPMSDELLATIKGIPNLKLIIVDTLARAMGGGDENNPSDMGHLLKTVTASGKSARRIY